MKSKVLTVIKREYMTRVKTKGFVVSIVLMPAMMFILTLLPSLMMMMQHKSDTIKTFIVFDETGEIFPKMQQAIANDTFFHHKGKLVYRFIEKASDFNGNSAAKQQLNQQLEKKEIQGYFEIPQDVFESCQVKYYAKSTTDFDLQGTFKSIISRIVTDKRLAEKGYSAQEVGDLMRGIHLNAYAVAATGEGGAKAKIEDEKTTAVKLGLTYILIFSLYLFTVLYATSVMRSVLEEKTTRIVEVIISSIKPYQLLLGKIIGVCSVCLTMFLIWGIFGVLLTMNINAILNLFGVNESPQTVVEVIHILRSTGPLYFGEIR